LARFIQIDEEGFFSLNGVRVVDDRYGQFLFQNLQRSEKGAYFTYSRPGSTEQVFVESFDEPFFVQQLHKVDDRDDWNFTLAHGYTGSFAIESIRVDEWDRFHALSSNEIPMVFSGKAQADFFNLVDSFTDNSFTVNGKVYTTKNLFTDHPEARHETFWTNIYNNETPRWDLGTVTPLLPEALPQLKIPKSRFIVLGCGTGNDAAHLAEQGHIVTAVDISPQAIKLAKEKYGHITNLTFIEGDIFNLGEEHIAQYDVVFEHTCYCAIPPNQRNKLVQVWRRLLNENGMLLGIFFVVNRTEGPPFGGSEWELRRRLENDFQFLYWTRAKHSLERRLGKELIVFAKKKG